MKVTLALVILGCVAAGGVLGSPVAKALKEQRTFIVQANNLPNEDKKEGNSPMDTSDPFLQIRDSHLNEVYRSETQENTLSPIFVVPFFVDPNEAFIFEVRDEDSLNPDDSLGSVIIPAAALVGTHALANPGGGSLIISELPTKNN